MTSGDGYGYRGTGRRGVLRAGAAAVLLGAVGCSSGGKPGGASTSSVAAPTATPTAATTPTAAPTPAATPTPLPSPPLWQPGPGEIQPDVKRRAVELVAALGAWPPGGQGVEPGRARVAALGLPPGLADQAGRLAPAAVEASLEVIDAQYGGILADSASVLVVCRQWTRQSDGSVAPGGITVDVRLSRAEPRWTVIALHPGDPGPAAASPAPAVAKVLAEPRIELPPEAEADLLSGNVHDTVPTAMLRLAGPYTLSVSVVRTGHPLDVFGTTRPSDHPLGRAFDVRRIDGRAVVDPATPRQLIESFMRDAAAAGSYNVGGPVAIAGAGNQFFTDDTHHDHVHIGFNS
ncbi:hypothetical protein ACIG0C_12460 [Kitasatospora aureofaciens]|uniref:Uncharacterized protein n=1 Tax=Kitasatospora aureofaciens TaxID=1894 RepID=A0A8H9HDR5_KITAU|nr:hypothetical protein [Kitasatospora aureofaciens]QEV03049.1 hypothetical protein CP971_30945 [Streptomyces viridifaciens]UKZ09697.1 hypothetical protein BOQ63_037915 [Streptomyces viridifaciens]GGU58703.1 hypothetical protein GCM10010502_06820 [Kitasatospora aureofaciens]